MNEIVRKPFQFSVSKIINAPLPFVYAWCTDFREDDYKISGQNRRIAIFERTANRFIMSIRDKRNSKVVTAARIVTFNPPNSWHLDWIGDENDERGDYRLTRLGAHKTRLNATFKVKPKASDAPRKSEMQKNVNAAWNRYASALEKDYQGKR